MKMRLTLFLLACLAVAQADTSPRMMELALPQAILHQAVIGLDKEIYVLGSPLEGSKRSSFVACFSPIGSLLWQTNGTQDLMFKRLFLVQNALIVQAFNFQTNRHQLIPFAKGTMQTATLLPEDMVEAWASEQGFLLAGSDGETLSLAHLDATLALRWQQHYILDTPYAVTAREVADGFVLLCVGARGETAGLLSVCAEGQLNWHQAWDVGADVFDFVIQGETFHLLAQRSEGDDRSTSRLIGLKRGQGAPVFDLVLTQPEDRISLTACCLTRRGFVFAGQRMLEETPKAQGVVLSLSQDLGKLKVMDFPTLNGAIPHLNQAGEDFVFFGTRQQGESPDWRFNMVGCPLDDALLWDDER